MQTETDPPKEFPVSDELLTLGQVLHLVPSTKPGSKPSFVGNALDADRNRLARRASDNNRRRTGGSRLACQPVERAPVANTFSLQGHSGTGGLSAQDHKLVGNSGASQGACSVALHLLFRSLIELLKVEKGSDMM